MGRVRQLICIWTCVTVCGVWCSEFPERECCDEDLIFAPEVIAPPPRSVDADLAPGGIVPDDPDSNFFPEFIPELSHNIDDPEGPFRPLDVDNSVSTTTGVHQGAPGKSILNCQLARQLCAEDVSCSSILHVIRHICGPETVACSTTTVTKCQAGLRTLQAFPYFNPTCLCREPYVDPECNYFRDFLFDHRCMVATQKEKDQYPIHALPTCTHAIEVCQNDPSCSRLYTDFKEHCKLKDGACRDRESCHNAWRGLRMTPLFGCICPNSPHKKKCDRVYNVVYNNSCLVGEPTLDVVHESMNWADRWPAHFTSPPDGTRPTGHVDGVVVPGTAAAESRLYVPPAITHRTGRSVLVTGASKSVAEAPPQVHSPLLMKTPNHPATGDFGLDVRTLSHFNQTSLVQTGSTVGSNLAAGEENETRVVIYQSTCHRALSQCQADGSCRRLLDPFLTYCDTCNRDLCMQALQGFYKDAPLKWTLDVAFCVCKKTNDRNDACLLAQERLHPDCARQPDRLLPAADIGDSSGAGPACHTLAEDCKAHPDCKPRLEFYEQACAVDVVTKGCAGPPSICRRAVLDILGTDLRTTCTCRGSDLAALYDCLEWQRLLWLNPCVVEAQRDFHRMQGNMIVVTAPSTSTTDLHAADLSGSTASTKGSTADASPPFWTDTSVSEETLATVGRIPSTDYQPPVTYTTPATPQRFCSLERPNKRIILIPEGSGKRLYHEDEPDCSELCRCGPGEVVTCSISDCAQRISCETPAATYGHSTAAFQAYRGECLCFSGSFVCAKPDPSQYSLPVGVFLFIGYSKADERAMYHFTNLNISKHLLSRLQKLIESLGEPENECRISIHEQADENIILQIRLADLDVQRANESVTLEMLTVEKEHCLKAADRLRRMVNNRSPEVHEDELLSVIKVADVTTLLPEPRRSCASLCSPLQLPLLVSLSLGYLLLLINR